MEKIKELGIIIIKILAGLTAIYFMVGGIHLLVDYMSEQQVKDSNFCEDLNMSFYLVVDNGFASSKIICLDNENNRQEYYYEEAFN